MHKGGYQKSAANIAATGLIRKGLVEHKRIDLEDSWAINSGMTLSLPRLRLKNG
jgi:hypothetical protein